MNDIKRLVIVGGGFAGVTLAQRVERIAPQKRGVVLSATSVQEKIAWSGHSAYTAGKAAVSMLTKTLASPHGSGAWLFAFFLVPETKGKTLKQIEAHWKSGKPARAL